MITPDGLVACGLFGRTFHIGQIQAGRATVRVDIGSYVSSIGDMFGARVSIIGAELDALPRRVSHSFQSVEFVCSTKDLLNPDEVAFSPVDSLEG